MFDRDTHKFILLLRKGVSPYEHIESWKRFDETVLPDKEAFYSSLTMEDITDVNYRNTKRVLKDCNNKKIGDYRNLYIESDILILADVFGNFGNIYIDIYELDSANFLSVARLP